MQLQLSFMHIRACISGNLNHPLSQKQFKTVISSCDKVDNKLQPRFDQNKLSSGLQIYCCSVSATCCEIIVQGSATKRKIGKSMCL